MLTGHVKWHIFRTLYPLLFRDDDRRTRLVSPAAPAGVSGPESRSRRRQSIDLQLRHTVGRSCDPDTKFGIAAKSSRSVDTDVGRTDTRSGI